MCVSTVPSSSNPGLIHSVATDQIMGFYAKSCSDPELTADKYWLEDIEKGEMENPRGGSGDLKANGEVLVTNMPLSSSWIPDNMVSGVV